MQETQEIRVQSLGWEDPLEKEMQPTPVSLPGESHGQRNLVGYSPWGRKEWDTTEHKQPLVTDSPSFLSFLFLQGSLQHFQNIFHLCVGVHFSKEETLCLDCLGEVLTQRKC